MTVELVGAPAPTFPIPQSNIMNEDTAEDVLDDYQIPDDLDEEKKEEIREVLREGRQFDLRQWLGHLLADSPFFAALSRRIEKKASRNIPTAGVMWSSERMNFRLIYNPYFMVQLTDEQKVGVLKHEFYHCLLRHVTDRMGFDPEENQERAKKWNYATDCAINSMPDVEGTLPESALHPDKFDLPARKASEWYMNNLDEDDMEQEEQDCPVCGGDGEIQKDPDDQQQSSGGDGDGDGEGEQQQADGGEGGDEGDDEQQQGGGHQHGGETIPCPHCSGSGSKQFDEHDWGDEDASDRAMAEDEIRRMSREARDKLAKQNRWGNVPQHLQKIINELIASQINWRRQLKAFVEKTQKVDRRASIKERSRKYREYGLPGHRHERESKLAISIDQSGSVSDEMLAHFFAELANLSDRVSFTVIPFDADIVEEEIFEWEKDSTPEFERVSCGGTDFDPPTRWVNEQGKFDGHIIMSDMYASEPVPSKVKRAWVKPSHCDPHFNTEEKVIEIDADQLT